MIDIWELRRIEFVGHHVQTSPLDGGDIGYRLIQMEAGLVEYRNR